MKRPARCPALPLSCAGGLGKHPAHMPDPLTPPQVYQTLKGNIERVIQGQDIALRKLLAAFASGGKTRQT